MLNFAYKYLVCILKISKIFLFLFLVPRNTYKSYSVVNSHHCHRHSYALSTVLPIQID